ncbi:hypothetical protein NHX12_003807 [Muraenolepis orangiensis]|uniref:B30.2/SPRY domain-containing protein n=1 Tax=Muraenolepis orangiensis TaxID=630683 RepID=A0A9Q0DWK9_9TELE|nr:hypothetical protein NHX12_003807 [Muraenolepis orangiensis]
MTVDPSTISQHLSLSDDNRTVTAVTTAQKVRLVISRKGRTRPDQVTGKCVSKESLTGHQYWEVKCKADEVSITMGYKEYSWSPQGMDDKSWTLSMKTSNIEFEHNKVTTKIPGPCPTRVGVYLDYRAGILCFYDVSGNMTLLHKVQTTFTQPLYAGLWLNPHTGCSAEFCYPLQV